MSKILKRALALSIGIAVVPVGLELGYRAVRLSGLSPTTHPAYVRHDTELGWSYRPKTSAPHTSDVFDVEVTINEQGFRGPDWPSSTGDKPCVLVLGDSFAFGWGVEFDESFSARLAQNTGWDVRNAAVSGYGTDQQRLLLERLLQDVEPDVVVSVFCWNDLFESSSDVVYGKHKPFYMRGPDGLQLSGVPVPQAFLARSSYAARAYHKWRWQRAHAARRIDREAEWRLVLDLYREEKRLLGDVPLLIVSDRGRLASLAEESEGIAHLDLRDVFEGFKEPIAFPNDGHWTPGAHDKIARALGELAATLLADGRW